MVCPGPTSGSRIIIGFTPGVVVDTDLIPDDVPHPTNETNRIVQRNIDREYVPSVVLLMDTVTITSKHTLFNVDCGSFVLVDIIYDFATKIKSAIKRYFCVRFKVLSCGLISTNYNNNNVENGHEIM